MLTATVHKVHLGRAKDAKPSGNKRQKREDGAQGTARMSCRLQSLDMGRKGEKLQIDCIDKCILKTRFSPRFCIFLHNSKPVFNSQKKIPEYLKARYVITAARGL